MHYNLGNVFAQMPNRLSEAIAEYQAAVRLQPDFAQAHNNLANALARTSGGMREAVVQWQAAVRLQPELAEAHYNLGNTLAQMPGRLNDAAAELEAGERIKPDAAMQQLLDRVRAAQRKPCNSRHPKRFVRFRHGSNGALAQRDRPVLHQHAAGNDVLLLTRFRANHGLDFAALPLPPESARRVYGEIVFDRLAATAARGTGPWQ